ncbi:Thermophilic metalloprotease (M29) [Anaeromicropila populeti]|uniref:Thermophilic metalloprotease (M29) n=2 Tax=Anaeromicropila populeti TaxID=37658 RepID=A0A1I6ISH4_9FIRM|nr:Thermophilic metalloprotease (M29) [Anaeromicropila populeti]
MEDNEAVRERYELGMDRIEELLETFLDGWQEEKQDAVYCGYFLIVAGFLKNIKEVYKLVNSGEIKSLSMEELEKWNKTLYAYMTGDGIEGVSYEYSYLNPDYAASILGKKDGKLLCFLFTELQGLIHYAFAQRLFDITIGMELFLEIYGYYREDEETAYKQAKEALYYYASDYCDIRMDYRVREMVDPKLSFATEIIMNSDLTDLRYLYRFGSYISKNEIQIAEYLNGLEEEAVIKLARTFTEGYRVGFINNKIDLSKKSVVNIRYNIGFERIIREAVKQFEAMGLKPAIYYEAVSSIHKKRNLKIGYCATSANRQYEYDHRFDNGLYFDKGFVERKLATYRQGFEHYKELASQYAGPAVLEIFGEHPFLAEDKENAITLSEKQQKLTVYYEREASLILNEYVKMEETSFTIMACPIPEIGADFQEIFDETVKVNTLDIDLYRSIQQKLIDCLDKGEYVHVKGRDNNLTDIKIMLHELENPEKETNFENCLADVNIPVGEVFTSPKLTGTEGVLHVNRVYLNDLDYKGLYLVFRDGMIVEYNCSNFPEKKKNLKFLEENLLCQHKSLPIGEFAIGTNTTAYAMGHRFQIFHLLPILIAEKTGPHFAVGDTCYKMSEDHKVYNPDGKEIVARENECSSQRKTDIEKAYFNCHTDITIPYDELGEIAVYTKAGDKMVIIENGRFVLEGTDELNKPLDGLR